MKELSVEQVKIMSVTLSQQAIICSKSAIETLEKDVKYVPFVVFTRTFYWEYCYITFMKTRMNCKCVTQFKKTLLYTTNSRKYFLMSLLNNVGSWVEWVRLWRESHGSMKFWLVSNWNRSLCDWNFGVGQK